MIDCGAIQKKLEIPNEGSHPASRKRSKRGKK
jgi:hypothetical protein